MKTGSLRRTPAQRADTSVRRNPIAEMNSIFWMSGAVVVTFFIVTLALVWVFIPVTRPFVVCVFVVAALAVAIARLRNRART